MRVVGALLAGLAAAIVLIVAVEFVSALVYPPPAKINMQNKDAMAQYVANMPLGAFAFVLLAWCVGTFTGAWLAARIGRSAVYGFIIGGVLLAAAVGNMVMIPHPLWFWGAGILVFVVTTYIAVRSALPARAAT